MDSTDKDSTNIARAMRRARIHYECARAKWALIGFAPVLLVIAGAAALTRRPSSALAFGAATFAVGATLLWYGRTPKRAVLPGLAAGLVPLVLALCANRMHDCMGDRCMMVCVPACSIGGVLAGLAVAGIGVQRRGGLTFWLSASAIALLTGSMGCSCVGYAGVVGLAGGYVAGLLPGLFRELFARREM
jgi:hypothetical protein